MTDKATLRNDLLKQDGTSDTTSAEIRDKVLATDRRRVRRMKWMAGISWAVFLTFFPLAALIEYGQRRGLPFLGMTTNEMMVFLPEYDWFVPMTLVITQALFILAVVMTFSLHMRSRTLTIHQIQASLADIEERLRKLTEKEPPAG